MFMVTFKPGFPSIGVFSTREENSGLDKSLIVAGRNEPYRDWSLSIGVREDRDGYGSLRVHMGLRLDAELCPTQQLHDRYLELLAQRLDLLLGLTDPVYDHHRQHVIRNDGQHIFCRTGSRGPQRHAAERDDCQEQSVPIHGVCLQIRVFRT
jgi:hypothetical protein